MAVKRSKSVWKAKVAAPSETQPFPLLELPLELRRMVYREIMADGSGRGSKYFRPPGFVPPTDQRLHFLLANKQVHAEAFDVFYDIFTLEVEIHRDMKLNGSLNGVPSCMPTPPLGDPFRRGTPDYLNQSVIPMPAYLPRIRRVEICLKYPLADIEGRCMLDDATAIQFKRLCYELAAQCHLLRDVVLRLSCTCSRREPGGIHEGRHVFSDRWVSRTTLTNLEDVCPTAEDFEQLLGPLERIRVSGSLQLICSCVNREEQLQPIFDRVRSVVQSSDPVKKFEGNELIWWQLMERGRPYLQHRHICQALHRMHETAQTLSRLSLHPDRAHALRPFTTVEEALNDHALSFRVDVLFLGALIDGMARRSSAMNTVTSSRKVLRSAKSKKPCESHGSSEGGRTKKRKADDEMMTTPFGSHKLMRHGPKGLEIDMNW
ncbi:MAG: hypothetical protein LQ341_005899 [Variospora aurantia]|nr:MAG: hypothetical protein LQ341_005899 [Variospora aurantia]